MSKPTPEQAWQHVKALWPDAQYIRRKLPPIRSDGVFRGVDIASFVPLDHCDIGWPEGVDRYPPPEPTYREPTQGDVGKMVEVRHNDVSDWSKRTLVAVLPMHYQRRFLCQSDVDWQSYCDWLEARIAVDETSPMSIDQLKDMIGVQSATVDNLVPTHPDSQPIGTAPKDRSVWLWNGTKWFVGWWSNYDWEKTSASKITHWREIK